MSKMKIPSNPQCANSIGDFFKRQIRKLSLREKQINFRIQADDFLFDYPCSVCLIRDCVHFCNLFPLHNLCTLSSHERKFEAIKKCWHFIQLFNKKTCQNLSWEIFLIKNEKINFKQFGHSRIFPYERVELKWHFLKKKCTLKARQDPAY